MIRVLPFVLAIAAMFAVACAPATASARCYGTQIAYADGGVPAPHCDGPPASVADPSPFSATLAPGMSVSVLRQCGARAYFTEFQAYHGNGAPLLAQVRFMHPHGMVAFAWPSPHGRAVTWDGRTFRNHLRVPALVRGWCS